MSYPESLESSLLCPDRHCPKVFDPQRNMVLCRCYQTQVTSPSNSHLLPATIPCTGSPPSYTGSMPYGECQTVPQSGLNYPSYLGYTSGFDGYGVYQSIYPQLSPNMTSTDWSMYGAQLTSPFSQPSQMDQILRSQVNDFWNYQQLSTQVNGSDIPATKQSTKLLKTWLREHKKNPYPTKTEKVMLAYAGRMTMTQISNWFANARRRMKQQKDQGSTSDSALSDVSEDDDSTCKSPTPACDLFTNVHAALKDPNFPAQHTHLTSFLKEHDQLMKIYKPHRMTKLKVESDPTETAVVIPESCNDILITDTNIKSTRMAEQKTAVVKPELCNDILITDTTIKSVRTADQKTVVVKPESCNNTIITDTTIKSVRTAEQKTESIVVKPEISDSTVITEANVNFSTTKSKIWSVSSILS